MQARGRISLLYQALLNSAPVATGWESMLSAIRNHTSYPANLRELIILRVAILNQANFEFEAHVPHALKAGISQLKIDAIANGQTGNAFDTTETLVLELTDHMTRDIVVPDPVFQRLEAKFSTQEIVEIVATVAAYNMVSRFLVALNIGH